MYWSEIVNSGKMGQTLHQQLKISCKWSQVEGRVVQESQDQSQQFKSVFYHSVTSQIPSLKTQRASDSVVKLHNIIELSIEYNHPFPLPCNVMNAEQSASHEVVSNNDKVQSLNKPLLNEVARNEDYEESDEEDSDSSWYKRKEIQSLERQIQRQEKKNRANDKVFVGTGFSFDITQYFQFKKQKDIGSTGDDIKTVFDELSGGHLSWIILIYSVCNAALIPAWIMNIKATKLLRICWRFFFQAIMVIPLVLYERRSSQASTLQQYKLSYIFDFKHLHVAYLSSLATSIWFTVILTTFEWTFISHALFLGSLANYFLSVGRTMRGTGHGLEPGGQVLITIGIIMMLVDIYMFNPKMDASPEDWNFINPYYLSRTRLESVIADLVGLWVSYVMAKFSVYAQDMKEHYPPYLSMLLVNTMVGINMMFSTFFLNGATFDHNTFWGIFSIFSQQHFAAFMYMGIILCMGLVISFVMLSHLFPDAILPSLAMTFEPAISTLLVYLAGVQTMPTPLSWMGYILIIPGTFLILIGHWMYQLINKKAIPEERSKSQLKIQKLKTLCNERRKRSLHRISQKLHTEESENDDDGSRVAPSERRKKSNNYSKSSIQQNFGMFDKKTKEMEFELDQIKTEEKIHSQK